MGGRQTKPRKPNRTSSDSHGSRRAPEPAVTAEPTPSGSTGAKKKQGIKTQGTVSFRDGPADAKLEALNPSSGALYISGDDVRNNQWNIESARANVRVKGGVWYYEVSINSDGAISIGWCTKKFKSDGSNQSLGSTDQSWGWDGSQATPTAMFGGRSEGFGKKWSFGSVVGCSLDFDKGEITYFLDGVNLGIAHSHAKFPAEGVYPAISLGYNQNVTVNFGQKELIHPQAGSMTIHSRLGADGLKKLDALFNKLRDDGVAAGDDAQSPNIQPEGVTKLCESLGISPEGIEYLVLAWKLGTKTPYEISRMEFIGGLDRLAAGDVSALQKKLNSTVADIKRDAKLFQKFYMFCFDYMKDKPTSKSIPLENAQATWGVVLAGRFPLLDDWIAFTTDHCKGVPIDVWRMVLKFVTTIGGALDKYSDSDGWPVLLDDFVEHMKSK